MSRRDFEDELGRTLCLITLHDAGLARGEFFAVVLFDRGLVTTWRQTAEHAEEPFMARLAPEELTQANELLAALGSDRSSARQSFRTTASVMGVSRRERDQVETLYFDLGEIPKPLAELAGLLKYRLEATNRPR